MHRKVIRRIKEYDGFNLLHAVWHTASIRKTITYLYTHTHTYKLVGYTQNITKSTEIFVFLFLWKKGY